MTTYIFSNVVNLQLHPLILLYVWWFQFAIHNFKTLLLSHFANFRGKGKIVEKKKGFVGVDIEEMQVHNNSLCLFVFLSNVKLRKKSEDARTETEDKLFRYAFGPHLIQLDPIQSMQFLSSPSVPGFTPDERSF